jgi:hypothetical protein
VSSEESADAAKTRSDRRAWLTERGYRIFSADMRDVEADVGKVLDELNAAITSPTPSS